MNLIYKLKRVIAIMQIIPLLIAFAVLFAGGGVTVNRLLLSINVLFVIVQVLNVSASFRRKQRDMGTGLLACLLVNIALMWVIYAWSWNYTVRALTIGFG